MPRGGSRPGAGRPTTTGRTVKPVSITMPPALLEALKAEAERRGTNVSKLAVELLAGALGLEGEG